MVAGLDVGTDGTRLDGRTPPLTATGVVDDAFPLWMF